MSYVRKTYDENGKLIKTERVTQADGEVLKIDLVEDFTVATEGRWPDIENKEEPKK